MKRQFLVYILCNVANCISAQNVGIGTSSPSFPLNFSSNFGDKISLLGNTGNHTGFGVQDNLLQIHTGNPAENIAFGYGNSGSFTERLRIINSGADGLTLKGRLTLLNGSNPLNLNLNETPGIWFYKGDNSGLLGFFGTQSNQNVGFYGGPVNQGWGFIYDAMNSRVGIGTSAPISTLDVNGQVSINIGVGSGILSPSSALEINSTTKGFLPPRMTLAQRNAITNPDKGLVVYCTDCEELQIYSGYIWKNIDGTAACVSPYNLPSIKICSSIWMVKNLDVSTYRNGDPIPKITDSTAWANLTTGAWCWYNNDSATYASTYGKLYNWYAVNDPRGLAPQGWHIPSQPEWASLINCIGNTISVALKFKEAGTAHWIGPNTGATNSSGFTALPAGGRNNGFTEITLAANFWGSYDGGNASTAACQRISFETNYFYSVSGSKKSGFSVRCVKD